MAIAAALYTAFCLFTKEKFNSNYSSLLNLVLWGFAGSFLFSFIEIFLMHHHNHQPFYLSDYKFSQRWYGALFTGLIYLYLQFNKTAFLENIDIILLAVCLGISIGKWGCFFSQHYGCYGTPTNLPWGIVFSDKNYSSIVPVHPIQIYDSLFHISLFFFLLKRIKSISYKPGIIFIMFMLLTSVYNFVIEYIRTNQVVVFGLTFAQITYILIFISSIFIFFRLKMISPIQ